MLIELFPERELRKRTGCFEKDIWFVHLNCVDCWDIHSRGCIRYEQTDVILLLKTEVYVRNKYMKICGKANCNYGDITQREDISWAKLKERNSNISRPPR